MSIRVGSSIVSKFMVGTALAAAAYLGGTIGGGDLFPPTGYAFLVDSDGKYLIDSDGKYIVALI